MARSRQDEVNKKINISNVGIYCQQLEEQQNLYDVGALTDAQSNFSLGLAHPRDDYLINPFCVTVSVLVSASLLSTYSHQLWYYQVVLFGDRVSEAFWLLSDQPFLFFAEC